LYISSVSIATFRRTADTHEQQGIESSGDGTSPAMTK